MPPAVIDGLEAVEIEGHDGERRAGPFGSSELNREVAVKGATIVKTGQVVSERLSLQPVHAPGDHRNDDCVDDAIERVVVSGDVVPGMRRPSELAQREEELDSGREVTAGGGTALEHQRQSWIVCRAERRDDPGEEREAQIVSDVVETDRIADRLRVPVGSVAVVMGTRSSAHIGFVSAG